MEFSIREHQKNTSITKMKLNIFFIFPMNLMQSPEIYKINAYKREIRLNVWKFADLIINKFKNNPRCFKKASHTFPEVKRKFVNAQ